MSQLRGKGFDSGLAHPKAVCIRVSDGFYYSTSAVDFEAFNASNIANYGIALSENAGTADYYCTNPSDTTYLEYLFVAAAGASLAVSDLLNNGFYEGYAGPGSTDITSIAGSTAAATNQKNAALVVYSGTITGTSTSTILVDSSLTQVDDNFWQGRIVIFRTGDLALQATAITASETGQLTVTALTDAPSISDAYEIL